MTALARFRCRVRGHRMTKWVSVPAAWRTRPPSFCGQPMLLVASRSQHDERVRLYVGKKGERHARSKPGHEGERFRAAVTKRKRRRKVEKVGRKANRK